MLAFDYIWNSYSAQDAHAPKPRHIPVQATASGTRRARWPESWYDVQEAAVFLLWRLSLGEDLLAAAGDQTGGEMLLDTRESPPPFRRLTVKGGAKYRLEARSLALFSTPWH